MKTFRKMVWLIYVFWEKRKLPTMVLIRNVTEKLYFEYLEHAHGKVEVNWLG